MIFLLGGVVERIDKLFKYIVINDRVTSDKLYAAEIVLNSINPL